MTLDIFYAHPYSFFMDFQGFAARKVSRLGPIHSGRNQRWRNKGALQAFFQASPKLACFAPKLFQTNLWRFCGISMGYKDSKRPLMPSKFFASGRPLSAAFCLIVRYSSVDGVHRGAATQTERILNLTDNPVFRKKYP